MKKLILLVCASITFTLAFAQTPQLLNYQAVIRNNSNQIVANSPLGMQVSILQGSVTGTPVYVERHFPTSSNTGIVTLRIGGGTAVTGNFANINWASGTYFVKTETDLNGGANYTISGTSQLLSVPYALSAKTAETAKTADNATLLNGKSPSNYKPIYVFNNPANDYPTQLPVDANSFATLVGLRSISGINISVPTSGYIVLTFRATMSVYGILQNAPTCAIYGQIVENETITPYYGSDGYSSSSFTLNLVLSEAPIYASRSFYASSAGSYTFYYRASYAKSNTTSATIRGGQMTALFIPL